MEKKGKVRRQQHTDDHIDIVYRYLHTAALYTTYVLPACKFVGTLTEFVFSSFFLKEGVGS